jgi:hypothetical protein
MNYSEKQIETPKKNYNAFLRLHTVADYDVAAIGMNEAERRMQYHNRIVSAILAGDKALEREWKTFFLSEEVKKDRKEAASKSKLAANKEASADVLDPIKAIKKMGEFGKWLNTSGNPYRKQHFSKVYTAEAVESFLQSI